MGWRWIAVILKLCGGGDDQSAEEEVDDAGSPECWLSRDAMGTLDEVAFQSSFLVRRRRALVVTLTEDSAMAAAAMTGESSSPVSG